MKKTRYTLLSDRYVSYTLVISIVVALLIHFPETISLFAQSEEETLFHNLRLLDVLNEIFFTFLSLLAMFAINTQVFRFNKQKKITWAKVALSFILMWALSNIFGQTFVFLHNTFNIPAIDAMVHHYLHPMRDFIISCMVTGSCYIIYLVRHQQQVLIENQQLRAENILNQYEVLKNQLNPHMLFNSLNTLQSLVREDQVRAQEYIQQLSRVLRYTLQGNESQSVSLREEMEFTSAYLFLLKMRFENNLQIEINIDKNLYSYVLPPMSIQVLIENAVKHNEISLRNPLTIHISSNANECIVVKNALQRKRSSTSGTGIGLGNLAKRYELLLGHEIQISEDTHFTVCIPLIRKQI